MHEYSFRWTVAEYVRACHAITRHMRGPVSTIPMLFAGAIILFIAAPAATGSPGAPWAVSAFGALLLMWAFYLYWGAPWLRARQILRDDPCAKDDVRHTITAEGFCARTGAVNVEIKWSHVVQIVETPEFLLFYFNKRAAYFTPKRAIPPPDLSLLRASLVEWVGDRARLTPAQSAAA